MYASRGQIDPVVVVVVVIVVVVVDSVDFVVVVGVVVNVFPHMYSLVLGHWCTSP